MLNVVYRGYSHIRVKVTFKLTLDIQDYLVRLISRQKNIKKLTFYNDQEHFTLDLHDITIWKETLHSFEALIDRQQIQEYLAFPVQRIDTPYSIVSNAVIRYGLTKLLLPKSIRYIMTLKKTVSYIKEAYQDIKARKLTMAVLDCSAVCISLAMNQSNSASNIMFMLGLGQRLDMWSMKKTVSDLEQTLVSKDADVWLVDENNQQRIIKSSQVKLNDILVYSQGQECLFDGEVVSGTGTVNESSLTGEFFPIEKKKGNVIYANTVVEMGQLYVKVTNAQVNSRIMRLIDLMKTSESANQIAQKEFIILADKVVKYNFIGAAVTYLLTRSFVKAISFLLVDFSCALKISTPVAYLSAIKEALNQHVLVKDSNVFDQYAMVDTYLFDKTGTLTTSYPLVEKVVPFHGFTLEDVIRISACLEEHIYHPLAHAIVSKADAEGIMHEEMHDKLYYIASKGIKSTIDGEVVVIGNLMLMEDEGVNITPEQYLLIESYKKQYHLLFLAYKKQLIGLFCIEAPLRQEAVYVLQTLKNIGKELVLATGDTAERTKALINELPFDAVYTNVKPEDKFELIKNLRKEGKRVAMIGDGLNDSAALMSADVGIVLNESADISKQMSDVVLLNNNLYGLLTLNDFSEKLKKLIHKNIHQTVIINSTLIGAGLINLLTPNSLSALHNLTTLHIVLRSLAKESFKNDNLVCYSK